MKKCPKCSKTYDDSWGTCLACSVPLDDMGQSVTEKTVAEEARRKEQERLENIDPQKLEKAYKDLQRFIKLYWIICGLLLLIFGAIFLFGDGISGNLGDKFGALVALFVVPAVLGIGALEWFIRPMKVKAVYKAMLKDEPTGDIVISGVWAVSKACREANKILEKIKEKNKRG